MRKILWICIGLSVALVAQPLFAKPPETGAAIDAVAIRGVLQRMCDAWDGGSIEGFVTTGFAPDAVLFANNITTGRAAILAKLSGMYTEPHSMGTFQFLEIKVDVLTPDSAVVASKYLILRPQSTLPPKNGLMTSFWKKGTGGWQMVHEHISTVQ